MDEPTTQPRENSKGRGTRSPPLSELFLTPLLILLPALLLMLALHQALFRLAPFLWKWLMAPVLRLILWLPRLPAWLCHRPLLLLPLLTLAPLAKCPQTFF
jgi:hypothetical protein